MNKSNINLNDIDPATADLLNATITNAADIANIPKSSNIRPLKNKRKLK